MKLLRLNVMLIIATTIIIMSCGPGKTGDNNDVLSYITSRATELNTSAELDKIVEKAGDKRLKLLGEASHGTHEYYVWRDSICRRLISEKGFSFIAVEGDWASLYELNRYVKDMEGAADSAKEVLENLDRWPEWMWGNEEVAGLIEWLREYNKDLNFEDKVGFYGKDVYDEWNSMASLNDFLEEHDGELLEEVKALYDCFAQYGEDSGEYARAVAQEQPNCSDEVSAVVELMRDSRDRFEDVSDYEYFYAKQNALVVKYAEEFYRNSAISRGPEGWNSRVEYMFLTVNRLLDKYGDDSKGIVWAHNTHVGDARATEMTGRGQVNIGQLAREDLGRENVFITGFGTYTGTVKAGSQWEGPRQKMNVPEAPDGSYEYLFNHIEYDNFILVFDENDRQHEGLKEERGHRAIGVVYNPAREVPGNYVMTVLTERYDAFIFLNETQALNPL